MMPPKREGAAASAVAGVAACGCPPAAARAGTGLAGTAVCQALQAPACAQVSGRSNGPDWLCVSSDLAGRQPVFRRRQRGGVGEHLLRLSLDPIEAAHQAAEAGTDSLPDECAGAIVVEAAGLFWFA